MSELREVPVLVLVSMIEMERADGRLPHDDAVLREVLVRIHPILVRGSEALHQQRGRSSIPHVGAELEVVATALMTGDDAVGGKGHEVGHRRGSGAAMIGAGVSARRNAVPTGAAGAPQKSQPDRLRIRIAIRTAASSGRYRRASGSGT